MPASSTGHALLARAFDDRREVLLHLRDRQAAQTVVRAELEDEDAHVALVQRPVEPLQTGGGRVAGNARIDDFPLVAVGVELLLQQRGEGLRLEQPESRRSGCRRARRSSGVRSHPRCVGVATAAGAAAGAAWLAGGAPRLQAAISTAGERPPHGACRR